MSFHIVKRDNCPLWQKALLYVAAIAIALLLGAVVLLAIDVNPIAYYTRMFTMGTIGNKIAYKVYINYLKEFVPLALTSVALSLAFKMKFWNIGGEGQFILGAIAASAVAISLGETLPSVAVLALCDKIMVLCHGKVMGVVHAHKTTKEELGLMMTGAKDLVYKYEDKPAGIARDTRFGEQEDREEA